jgi:hypothetical protein
MNSKTAVGVVSAGAEPDHAGGEHGSGRKADQRGIAAGRAAKSGHAIEERSGGKWAALGSQRRPLPRQDRRESERRQHRQQFGVARVFQEEVQKSERDHQAHDRQLETAGQYGIERQQEDHFLGRLALEVRRLPFADHAEHVAQPENA